MKSCRNHLPPLESHFYSSSIFTPPTTASFSPHALSARLPPLQVFFSRILPVLPSPRLPPFSFLLCLAFSLLCPTPLLHQAFSNSLCWAQPQLQTYIPKELKHLMFGWKWKREKTKNKPYTLDLFAQLSLPPPSIPPSLPPSTPPLHICFPPSSPSYVPPHPKCCLFIIAEVF